jgi:hypothetical protein
LCGVGKKNVKNRISRAIALTLSVATAARMWARRFAAL